MPVTNWTTAAAELHREAEIGKKAADLATVSPGQQGERTNISTTSTPDEGKLPHVKQERLRAVLRSPEPVQDLYRQDLINQKDAAKIGSKRPTPDEAAKIAEGSKLPDPSFPVPPTQAFSLLKKTSSPCKIFFDPQ